MLTGRRLFQSKNDITKMRELLAAPILPPSAIDAMIPRELDRIVMRSLEIDPKDRYQTAADMAADLERTLIAARYSSRELSKLLRELYLGGDDPLVVIDASDDGENLERTIAITSTETLPPVEQTRSTRPEHETQLLDGVLRAERSRLQWARWRARLKVMIISLAVAAALGAVAFVAKKYLPELLRRPPAAPGPEFIKNQYAPKPEQKAAPSPPVAKPPVKKRPHKAKAHTRGAAPAQADAPLSPDAPLPPTPE
jgi:serine/threonine protein kinase